MKITAYLLGLALTVVMFSSCKKDEDNDDNGTPTGYYFKANVGGQEYLFEGQSLQSGSGFIAHMGGYVTTVNNLFKAGGIFVEVNSSSAAPSEADVLALEGDTLTLDQDLWPHAIVEVDATNDQYTTLGTSKLATDFLVFTDIEPLGPTDTGTWDVYAVRGNFRTQLEPYSGTSADAVSVTGEFYMRVTTNR